MDLDVYVNKLYNLMDRKIQSQILNPFNDIAGYIYCEYPYMHDRIQPFFPNAKICSNKKYIFSAALVWGHSTSFISSLEIAERDNCPILLCEDGFIRSLDTWCNKKAPEKNRITVSVIIDSNGYYFDSVRNNNILQSLNNKDIVISKDNINEAKKLIDFIVNNKITKYNHQPLSNLNIGSKNRKKILVIDQSYGDFSIIRGGADNKTFDKMLSDAINQNPDHDILIKTHPDILAQSTQRPIGYYQNIKQHDNIYPVRELCNPYALMQNVDKVYVCTSQFGLEALLNKKEVHTYGKPIYAGWGFTYDNQNLSDMRHNKRTLEEFVYLMYFEYTHWLNPDTLKKCSIYEALNWILKNRYIK